MGVHDAAQLAGNADFPEFLVPIIEVIAARGSSELVKAKIAREIGISETALTSYIELMDQMYVLQRIPGWSKGYTGRPIKRPKISLIDSGLSSYFSGFSVEKAALAGGFEYFGALLESFVGAELRKQQTWSAQRFRLHHLRDGLEEIDIVIELADGRVLGVEVKSALDVGSSSWQHLVSAGQRLRDRFLGGVVFYLGAHAQHITVDGVPIAVLPVSCLWEHPELSGHPSHPI